MNMLHSQPTMAPNRKVTGAGVGALIAVLLSAVFHASGIPFLEKLTTYPGFEAALGGGLAFGIAYFVREKA